jgi:2-oxoglutarate dehydrogenase E1 component
MNINVKSIWTEFSGLNTAYLSELYETYREDPGSVDPETRAFFERWGAPPAPAVGTGDGREAAPVPTDCDRISAARALATGIRMYSHHAAQLDPLGSEPSGDAELLPETHGIRDEDLVSLPASVVGGPPAEGATNALEAVQALRKVYMHTSGYEFEHISDSEERQWLWEAVESGQYRSPKDPIDEQWLLERLTSVEAFERFLQSAFPTQNRFTVEGVDMTVPMLDELMTAAAEVGTRQVILGMAHRGRLNVLTHVLGKPYEEIIAEFRGSFQRPNISVSGGSSDTGWTGDVKYHLGAGRSMVGVDSDVEMQIAMPPNPSHLEFINPVAVGMTRAACTARGNPGAPELDELAAICILLHGDTSFPGQGVVAETFNLSQLPGYRVGGTIHIITNNQLGFTTPPELGRSTLYASDLAKGFEVPIIHVNADDPEACIHAVRVAHAYMHKFRKDALIDLVGYRRLGHNEGDEPSFTQPMMYAKISQHPRVRDIWARELIRRGTVSQEQVDSLYQDAMARLQEARRAVQGKQVEVPVETAYPAGLEAGGTAGGIGRPGPAKELETAVAAETLADLNEQMMKMPEGFKLNPKLEPFFARRRSAFQESRDDGEKQGIDWAHAEALALASILADGTPIRFTGEDVARGTFSHRHARLRDVVSGGSHTPLQSIPAARASFEIWETPLTEMATMGFEYGYSVQAPETLVLWEAQYGDFVNGAQVILDTFLTAAKSKWGVLPSTVLLLPHGYEGHGPEHSSARLERFLQMAAEDNMRIANCTTAAQYFHVLRRQAALLKLDPRPLVLMTPKSLLRHFLAASDVDDLAKGRFQPVIDDAKVRSKKKGVRRLILCSGKVYVDLEARRSSEESSLAKEVAVLRVEELYPFPADEIKKVVKGYPNLKEVMWVQEEPRNMGAWTFVAPRLRDLIRDDMGREWPIVYAGRTRRASPAEGAHEWHVREQKRLVDAAFGPLS